MLVDRKHAVLGRSLGEAAGVVREWLGLGRLDLGKLVLVVVPDTAGFRAWSRGNTGYPNPWPFADSNAWPQT